MAAGPWKEVACEAARADQAPGAGGRRAGGGGARGAVRRDPPLAGGDGAPSGHDRGARDRQADEVRRDGGVPGLPRRRVHQEGEGVPQEPVVRGMSRARRQARGGSIFGQARGPPRPEVLPSLPHLRCLPAHGLPADQPDEPQPAEALHHLPQPPRSGSTQGPAGVLGLPRADRADEGRLEPRAARLHDLSQGAPAAQDGAQERAALEAGDARVLRGLPREGRTAEGRAQGGRLGPRRALPVLAMPLPAPAGGPGMNKRDFLKGMILFFPAGGLLEMAANAAAKETAATDAAGAQPAARGAPAASAYNGDKHYYGMGIEIDKCIGCSRCVEACKAENDVPQEPFYFRTWIERD